MDSGSRTPSRTVSHPQDLFHTPLPHSDSRNQTSHDNTNDSSSFQNPNDKSIDSQKTQLTPSEEGLLSPDLPLGTSIYTRFDIYGNELKSQNNIALFDDEESPEAIENHRPEIDQLNKENTDPILGTVTPLKKRGAIPHSELSQGSNGLIRSPLVDITPPCIRKKGNQNKSKRIERVLLYTPMQGTSNKSGQASVMKSMR